MERRGHKGMTENKCDTGRKMTAEREEYRKFISEMLCPKGYAHADDMKSFI